MDVYWLSGSPYAWRVLLAFEIKKIAYNSKLLSMDKGELKAPEYLAINPRGMVPAIVDGDLKLPESLAIITYLEAKQPSPPLLGQTPAEKARIMQEISETTSYLEPVMRQIAGAILFNKLSGKEQEINEAAEKLRGELAKLEQKLKANEWLVGKSITAADLWLFPFIMLMERAANKPLAKQVKLEILPLAKHYPAMMAWVERIQALPGYDRTYPPHWREQAKVA